MPEYLSPGVYVEEIEIGAKPIEGVSTSTAGFLGETERGPTTPQLVTSWLQFQRLYGSYLPGSRYLPYAVEGFFANGGQRCYIARVVGNEAIAASTKLTKGTTEVLTVTATGGGEWGNKIKINVDKTSGGFKFTVTYKGVEEVFDNISIEKESVDYYDRKVNGISAFVKISKESGDVEGIPDGPSEVASLTGGADGLTEASTKLTKGATEVLTVTATGAGNWGNHIKVKVEAKPPKRFKLTVTYKGVEEVFDNISVDEESVDYYDRKVNGVSAFVKISKVGDESVAPDGPSVLAALTGGTDTKTEATSATLKLKKGNKDALTVTAKGTGNYGNSIQVKVEAGTSADSFKLTVTYPDVEPEVFDNVSVKEGEDNYYGKVKSKNVIISKVGQDSEEIPNKPSGFTPLMGGKDPMTVGSATLKLKKGTEDALTATATEAGKWGNDIKLKVGAGTFSGFKLTVTYKNKKDVFDNLSVDSTSADYYGRKVNGISAFVAISKEEGDSGEIPDSVSAIASLTQGKDGDTKIDVMDYTRTDTDIPGKRMGLTAFSEIDEISIVYAPNSGSIGLNGYIVTHCESLKDRFAIIDAESGLSNVSAIDPRSNIPSKYAAFYYPWIKVYDPLTKSNKLVPPGGHMAGIYARSDTERGVHKAPANEVVRGVVGLEFSITKGEQDILNPRGVNCIRAFPGRGIRIWGGRTLSSDALWKYINVRRLFIFLEESIDEGTQWVVFEPNDEKLWARVKQSITQFLTRVWKDGALMGTTPEEAFFVKCDRTTMTQDDIDNGRLIVLIGVAPVKPAEFVIFRIAQWAGGSAVTE